MTARPVCINCSSMSVPVAALLARLSILISERELECGGRRIRTGSGSASVHPCSDQLRDSSTTTCKLSGKTCKGASMLGCALSACRHSYCQ